MEESETAEVLESFPRYLLNLLPTPLRLYPMPLRLLPSPVGSPSE